MCHCVWSRKLVNEVARAQGAGGGCSRPKNKETKNSVITGLPKAQSTVLYAVSRWHFGISKELLSSFWYFEGTTVIILVFWRNYCRHFGISRELLSSFWYFEGNTVIIFCNAPFIEEILQSSTQAIFYILPFFYIKNFTSEEIRENVKLYVVADDIKLHFWFRLQMFWIFGMPLSFTHSLTLKFVLRPVHSLFQRQFSTECNLLFPLSIPRIFLSLKANR